MPAARGFEQREFRAVGLPFRAEARLEHPLADEHAAAGRTGLIDRATLLPIAVWAPNADRFDEFVDADDLAAQAAAAAGSARRGPRQDLIRAKRPKNNNVGSHRALLPCAFCQYSTDDP